MARELGWRLDAMELQVGANAAIGIIGRQGLGKVSHVDLRFLWLQAAARGRHPSKKAVGNATKQIMDESASKK